MKQYSPFLQTHNFSVCDNKLLTFIVKRLVNKIQGDPGVRNPVLKFKRFFLEGINLQTLAEKEVVIRSIGNQVKS